MYDSKKYYQENREKIIQKVKEYNKQHREQQLENLKKYRAKKLAEDPDYYKKSNRKYRLKNPPKQKPQINPTTKNKPKVKTVGSGRSNPKSNIKLYLDHMDLTEATIISQARGKVSNELWNYWKLMVENYSNKFIGTNKLMVEDAKQDCYINLAKNLHNYNSAKYESAFPYWTELVKRTFYLSFNNWNKYSKNNISLEYI